MKVSLSALSHLHIKLFLRRGAAFMLVTEMFFPPCRKPGVGVLTWGAGLNSISGYDLGRRSSLTLSPTPSGGDLTPKFSLLLAYHYHSLKMENRCFLSCKCLRSFGSLMALNRDSVFLDMYKHCPFFLKFISC